MNHKLARFFLLSFTVLAGLTPFSARAEEKVIELCPKLAEEDTYKDQKDFKWIAAGKDGWIFRTDYDLKQDEYELSDWASGSFKRLNEVLGKRGTTLVVSINPTRGLVGHPALLPPYDKDYDLKKAQAGYEKLIDMFSETGIITANSKDAGTVSGFFLKRDNHWTAVGAKYMAQKVADAVKANPVYASLKKAEFVTTEAPAEEGKQANDNFLEFIEETCGKMPEPETIKTIYTTSRKDTGDAAQALLGEQAEAPEVVLWGTSNSTEPEPSHANFAGFLKEYLSADVNNASVQGGSIRGAIGSYVLTGQYDTQKPKVALWELSAHYGLDQDELFREMIPAIYGDCSDEEAIATASGQLEADQEGTVILKDLAAKSIFSRNYFVSLELENKDIREIAIHFVHDGDKKDKVKLERSVRNFPENPGKFYSELHYNIDKPLKEVRLQAEAKGSAYKAKICKMDLTLPVKAEDSVTD